MRRNGLAHQSFGGRGPEATGETFGQVLAGREIHDIFGLDHIPRHGFDAADPIGQTEFDAPLTGPDQPAKQLWSLLQTLATPLLDHVDELVVDLREHFFRELLLLRIQW